MYSLKIGDILRVTKFGAWIGDGQAWAEVVAPSTSNYQDGQVHFFLLEGTLTEDMMLHVFTEVDDWFVDDGDIYEVVPEEDVPDRVWAARALHSLS